MINHRGTEDTEVCHERIKAEIAEIAELNRRGAAKRRLRPRESRYAPRAIRGGSYSRFSRPQPGPATQAGRVDSRRRASASSFPLWCLVRGWNPSVSMKCVVEDPHEKEDRRHMNDELQRGVADDVARFEAEDA